jgi:hypothetical protein
MAQKALSPEAERQLKAARRAGARLAAVQALYQMEQTGQSGRSVIADFMEEIRTCSRRWSAAGWTGRKRSTPRS